MTHFAGWRTCRGCGCDDNHACVTAAGPCAWVLLDVETPTGVCSACAEMFRWHPALLATIGLDDEATDEILFNLGFEIDFARRQDLAHGARR